MTTTVVTAGLIDDDGNCVNAILVHVDDDTHEVVGYAAPEGLTLVLNEGAGVGKVWDGEAFQPGDGS